MERSATKQGRFEFPFGWGGLRKGAGPKPKGERAGVSHRTRAALASRFPVLVTMRLAQGLPSLRRRKEHAVLLRAFAGGCEREGFRMVHYSVQSNHLHLLVEGKDRDALSRGMQGLSIRIARGLNRLWKRTGKVLGDRYHDRILRSPREVWNGLRYVLNNARKHQAWLARGAPDPFSSGRWFDGWEDLVPRVPGAGESEAAPSARARARARTWLLGVGWRRHGLISLVATPGS